VAGIVFVVLFIIGPFIIQGETPSRTDSIEEVRKYFDEDGQMYLIGDYIAAIAFIFFFLPFAVTLRWVIGSAEGWPPIFSWLTVVGAVTATVMGGIGGTFWGALAIGAATNPEVDDSSIRTLMELDAYAFTILSFAAALFLGSASIVIVRTGVLWRWLGGIGLLGALAMIIGAAWPIDGDEEGAIAIFGFVGFLVMVIWILIASIALIMRKDAPMMERGA
jgi:hypothetical protein